MPMESVAFVAAIAIGLTFLASSAGKLRAPGAFVIGVLEYRVLPPRLARVYGRVLPLAEVACGLALIAGVWPPVTGALSAALPLSFLIAVTINLARGRTLDCHCFGSRQSEPLGWTTVARLIVLLAAAVIVTRSYPFGWPFTHPDEIVPAVLLGCAGALLIYVLGTLPVAWRAFQPVVNPRSRIRSNRISVRNLKT